MGQSRRKGDPSNDRKARSKDLSALKVASPKGKPQIASPKGKPSGVVDVQENDKVREVEVVDDTNDLAEKERGSPEGASSDPYEGGAEWETQRDTCPHQTKSVFHFVKSVSKTMCQELRHKTNRRSSDYSLSPSDLAYLISDKLWAPVTVRDVCASTYLFEQDKAKPRYELKLRPATGADKTRFPQHLIGNN